MSGTQTPAGRGAVDLTPIATPSVSEPEPASAPIDPAAPAIAAPLITEVTERNFEDAMALSQTVPVVLVLYSNSTLSSKQSVAVMEDVARASQGAFQLGKVDVDTSPALAQAFQVESIPAAIALVARRPVPLFEGVPTTANVQQILSELFQVAPQLGVVGHLKIDDAELEKPMPPEHATAREAEDAGDWKSAIKAWKKVLANNPSDHEAKTALVRAKFELRQEAQTPEAEQSAQSHADELFAKGQEGDAFDLLLSKTADAKDSTEREALRKRIVDLFQIASDKDAVKKARGRLATLLMI